MNSHFRRLPGNSDGSGLYRPVQFGRSARSGLWLPSASRSRRQRTEPVDTLRDFTKIALTWSNLFQEEPDWDDVARRLQRYSLSRILGLLGQISSILDHYNQTNPMVGQRVVADGLFEDRASEILGSADRAVREFRDDPAGGNVRGFALFYELQIVNTAKIALLEVEAGDDSDEDSVAALGEALLMVGDLIEAEDTPDVAENEARERREHFRSFFVQNALFHSAGSTAQAVARAHELYLRERNHLDDGGAYINLRERAEELTGVDPALLQSLLLGFLAHWTLNVGADDEELNPTNFLHREQWFAESDLTPEERRAALDIVASTPNELRDQFEDRGCEPGSLKVYDALPLQKRPLVELNERLFCPSISLLEARVTRGLHHLFMDHDVVEDPDERERFMIFVGRVFEDYCEEVLRRAFNGGGGRFLSEDDLRGEEDPEEAGVCDAGVLYPRTVILWEFKSGPLPAAVRAEGQLDVLDEQIERRFVEAAGQLDATIQRAESGALTDAGIDPRRTRRYLPVVVLQEELPMNALLYGEIEEQVAEEGHLDHAKAAPLQVLDVRDLELIEVAANRGRNVATLLRNRVVEGQHQMGTFVNYLHQQDDQLVQENNAYLAERFRQIADESVRIMRERTENGDE